MTSGALATPRRIGAPLAVVAAVAVVAVAILAGLFVTGRLGGAGSCGPSDSQACTRVLFLGNSYTDVNDLPQVFSELAASGGQRVGTGKVAPGGEELSGHVTLPETQVALASRWNVVVLQEQSQVPAFAQLRAERMAPAARSLVGLIRALGARPILLETWGHRDGSPENGLPDYDSMQTQLGQGYLAVGHELDVTVSPVGEAWRTVRLEAPELDLWQPDGSHPTIAGTYLAACVIYTTVFRRSPVGVGYGAGLPGDTATLLQSAAAQTVLTDPGRWEHP